MKNQLIKIMLGISAIPAFAHSMEKPLSVDLFVGATGLNKIELLRSYIDKGVNLDAIDSFGNTALTTAAEYNNIVAARMLLANGADVNAKDAIGWYSSHHSVTVVVGSSSSSEHAGWKAIVMLNNGSKY